MNIDLQALPVWPQSQESLSEQMAFLIQVANRLGFHDAADAAAQMSKNLTKVQYGCHVDLEPGQRSDGCVIDTGRLHDCIYANPGMRKEQCKYWKIVTPLQPENPQL